MQQVNAVTRMNGKPPKSSALQEGRCSNSVLLEVQ